MAEHARGFVLLLRGICFIFLNFFLIYIFSYSVCVCVCVCVGVGEEVKGEKKRSVRDGRSEQGPGGTHRRHQSIGPTAVHSGF